MVPGLATLCQILQTGAHSRSMEYSSSGRDALTGRRTGGECEGELFILSLPEIALVRWISGSTQTSRCR